MKNGFYLTLIGKNEAIEEYRKVFGENVILVQDNNQWFLTNEEIRLSQSSVEAMQKGSELLNIMHGIMSVGIGAPYDICINGFIENGENQKRGVAEILCEFTVVNPLNDNRINEIKEIQHVAFNNEDVKRCLIWFSHGAPNLYDAYKIYEVISKNCEKREKNINTADYITETDLKKLKCNLNTPAWHEDARHAIGKGQIPSKDKYLTKAEIDALVKKLFNNWIRDLIIE
jgi:hypothetical protein